MHYRQKKIKISVKWEQEPNDFHEYEILKSEKEKLQLQLQNRVAHKFKSHYFYVKYLNSKKELSINHEQIVTYITAAK